MVLESVKSQSAPPFEVLIADDGSGEATADKVREVLAGSGLQWKHVRHDDNGIRQARVKNLAVRYAGGDYFIFIDHDVVLHPDFVKDHLAAAEENCFLQGKRAFMPAPYTRKLLEGSEAFTPPSFLMKGLENRKNAIRLPGLGEIMGRKKKFQTSLRGCNVSMHKKDFMLIDGYDEFFDATWGREDSDVCYRLFYNGIRIKNLWFSGLQYHLDHKVIKNREKDILDLELEKIVREKRRKARQGFSTMSAEGDVVASS